MRKILKPACILAAVMLAVGLMPDSASAGRRNRCGNSCGSSYGNCGNSCATGCGNACGSSGAACAVQANVMTAPAVAPDYSGSNVAQSGNRVQYQSAFQAPVNSLPAPGPVYSGRSNRGPIYLNGVDTVSDRSWRYNWDLQNRADRKIRGL